MREDLHHNKSGNSNPATHQLKTSATRKGIIKGNSGTGIYQYFSIFLANFNRRIAPPLARDPSQRQSQADRVRDRFHFWRRDKSHSEGSGTLTTTRVGVPVLSAASAHNEPSRILTKILKVAKPKEDPWSNFFSHQTHQTHPTQNSVQICSARLYIRQTPGQIFVIVYRGNHLF